MAQHTENPLVSSKPSDSGITVSLHPLVLLTVSDQITRHRVRGETGPIAGILLGQQNGREITAEHAFSAGFDKNEQTRKLVFKQPWLQERVQQYRDVHKAPALEVVGWFTLCPESGPFPELVPLQNQITLLYNETGVLLAIHPEAFEPTHGINQKLPLTIYESVAETDPTRDDASMQIDGEENSDIKFRPIPYTVETDEAEMIAIDYVAKGAGSAAAVSDSIPKDTTATSQPEPEDKKGKKRADAPPSSISNPESTAANDSSQPLDTLIPEEQDQIASIQTRLNSVRMLQTRLHLLQQFLSSLPPSYISSTTVPLTPTSPSPSHLPHLRNIQSLLTRLSLLTPTPTSPSSNTTTSPTTTLTALEAATKAQSNDVALTHLLSLLHQDIQSLSELGRKFATVENARNAKRKNAAVGGFGGLGDFGDEVMQAASAGMGGGGGGFGREIGGGGGGGRGTVLS